jgi:hypothetical protein
MKVRIPIALQIDRSDKLLNHETTVMFARDQHVQLKLVTGRLQAEQMRDQCRRHASQSSLGVNQAMPNQKFGEHASEDVADAAAQRHVARELTHSHD